MNKQLVIVADSFPENQGFPRNVPMSVQTDVLRSSRHQRLRGKSSADTVERVYEPPLSMVAHQELWLPWRDTRFDRIDVLGSQRLHSCADALAIAAHLRSERVIFHGGDGNGRDVTSLVRDLRVDFHAAAPVIHSLADAEEARLKADMNRHYLSVVSRNNFQIPQFRNEQTKALDHFQKHVGLAHDLMMRVPEICEYPWWSLGLTPAGHMVRTVDHRLAYAMFLERFGAEGCLEVGCGSGFLPVFLASRGRFGRVAGVDAVENRVAGARLLAKLADAKVELARASVDHLPFRDGEFDLVFTCFTLEQCQEILDAALDELFRVARRYVVLFEPSLEVFPTLPGLVHIEQHGYPSSFMDRLNQRGMPYSVLRPTLRHYFNPGALFVISLDSAIPWHVANRDALDAAA